MLRTALTFSALFAAGWLIYARLKDIKEILVANFDALNAKLDEQDAARADAIARVNDDVQALRDQIAALELDTDDQAKVDAIVQRVKGNIDALNAIDPVRADDGTVPGEPAVVVEPQSPTV